MSCCSSPIEYLIEYADFAFQNSGFTMEDVLTIGHVFPNTVNICCPDYCSQEYILLGERSDIVDFNNRAGFNFGECCVNLYSIEGSLIPEYFTSGIIACCNTNTTAKCINELLEHTNSTALKEWFYISNNSTTGLFEYNTINQNFGFCELVEILKTKTPLVAEEYMLAILQLGLAISCRPNGTFVGGLETYVDTYYPV
jgi:hypothetical protein